MNAQYALIEDTYNNLIRCYSTQHSCAFLQASWLLNENASFLTKSFNRMVFSDGNRHEIYTKHEREFIACMDSDIDYFYYPMQSKRGVIDCCIISIDFSFSMNSLYDSIEFMKIFNKAFDGFNTFLFVCDRGIHIGCSCIKSGKAARDCAISPLITPKINWEMLGNELLYRNDSCDFYEHYSGIINMINAIRYCFANESIDRYPVFYPNSDCDDDLKDILLKILIDEYYTFGQKEPPTKFYNSFDEEFFDAELEWCFNDLKFIKTSRPNPLEVLFEAEKALEQTNNVEQQYTNSPDVSLAASRQSGTTESFELLDDPIALMKKLKRERDIKVY